MALDFLGRGSLGAAMFGEWGAAMLVNQAFWLYMLFWGRFQKSVLIMGFKIPCCATTSLY